MKTTRFIGMAMLGAVAALATSTAKDTTFRWVNPLPDTAHERLTHGTFQSESMGIRVGYVIYLPPGYEDPGNAQRRYPVVY